MPDVAPPAVRSTVMAGIKGKNTKPEMRMLRALFLAGYRFRLHSKDLPGNPDIVLPGRRVAIFADASGIRTGGAAWQSCRPHGPTSGAKSWAAMWRAMRLR